MSYFNDFVIPTALCAPSDVAAWTGQAAPSNAVQLIRAATSLILDATEAAYYDVDPTTGLATDSQIGTALLNACCIQVAAWAALNFNPLTGGVIQTSVSSADKIGTASQTMAGADIAAQANFDAITGLVPEAMRMLRQNNLLVPTAWAFG